ncbi:MAG: hypothetical protein NVS2B12_04460 [Ktedonobacteraceae bacterium]
MRKRSLDLLAATCIGAINVVWSLLPNHISFVGLILALPLIFLLPGYTLTEALLPAQAKFTFLPADKQLTGSSRFTFSIGLSIIVDILGGFVLNLLPSGLHAIPWAIFLALVTMLFASIALYQRIQLKRQHQGQDLPKRIRTSHPLPSLWEGALLCFSILLVLAALLYSVNSAQNQPYPGFTQFWVSNPTAHDTSCTVHLGVKSFEFDPLKYNIIMTTNDEPFKTWSGISLGYQQTWDQAIVLPTSNTTTSIKVKAQLYREDQPKNVYRQIHTTVYIEKAGSDGSASSCKKF